MKASKITYTVREIYSTKKLSDAISYAQRIGATTFVAKLGKIEKGYETTTWKTKENIENDLLFEQ
jgi:hypothetical protein